MFNKSHFQSLPSLDINFRFLNFIFILDALMLQTASHLM